MKFLYCALFLAFTVSTHAADNTPNRNLVSFSASAKEDVASDVLVARLFVEQDAREQAKAADAVNQAMAKALATARQTKGVKAQTLDYRSDPIYDEQQKIASWRVHQGLRLESAQHDTLTALLGSLQGGLAIEAVSYEISDSLREAVTERLTDAAIKRFSERAQKVAASFGRKGYTLVNANLDQRGNLPQPMMYAGRAMAMKAEVANPAIEAGTQSVEVVINGTIELAP
ncbi:MAG: SIMPL domain-containing protein [Proteobacteria bacterium]|nr:SIMPL domain-containing protein [Pseudomonadota bacterium]